MNDTPEPTEPAAEAPAETPPAPEAPAEETDWKAEARKWEKTAKENKNAAARLAKLEQQHMTEQEKAVAKAKAEGATEAVKKLAVKLAAAEFKAAAAAAGADVSGVADWISYDKFLDEDGEVDEKAIAKAVKGLPKTSAPRGGKSGGDFGGAPGQQPKSLEAQIRDAEAKGDTRESIRLKNLQLINNNQ